MGEFCAHASDALPNACKNNIHNEAVLMVLDHVSSRDRKRLILRHWGADVSEDRLAHLIRDTGRLLGGSLAWRLARHDIPYGHWTFLRVLWKQDGLTQRELSDAVHVSEPTTFAAVKALEARGFITRCHEPGNKRKLHVYVTPEGAALQEVLVPLAEDVNRIAIEGIDPNNLKIMRDTLLALLENLAKDELESE
ncbi:MAG: DNA-binding MarR family transcriptional regulator [Alphaproteobacteria bacterium]